MTNLVSMCSLVYFGTVVSNESAFKTELENEKKQMRHEAVYQPFNNTNNST